MFGKLLCKIGVHVDEVASWTSWEGWLICKRCERLKPMTGPVLAEWIRYRSKK